MTSSNPAFYAETANRTLGTRGRFSVVVLLFAVLVLAPGCVDPVHVEHAWSAMDRPASVELYMASQNDADLAVKDIVQHIQTQVQKTPFSFLQKAETENLLTFIQDEHPQTIALIVCHLPHHKASEILVGLPAQKQIEVIKRIANMEQTSPEVVQEVERGLEGRLSAMLMRAIADLRSSP